MVIPVTKAELVKSDLRTLINHLIMRHLLVLSNFLLLSLIGFSQPPVSCDLGVFNTSFKNATGGPVDANTFAISQVVRLQLGIGNFSFTDAAPGHHFSIVIGLGSGLILKPTYNLSTAPLSNYFTFTYNSAGFQPTITAEFKADLPANFTDLTYFELIANVSGTSTASFNITIDNPGPPFLTDPNAVNNNAFNTYTISAVTLPVTFAGVSASVKNCNANVSWNIKGETNVSHYEVEVSKDGTGYSTAKEVPVLNTDKYNASIPLTEQLKSPVLYFRVKSVDKDRKFAYSEVKMVKGQCEQSHNLNIALYPNPVSGKLVTITSLGDLFNGQYTIVLIDKNGKVYQNRELELNNVSQYTFNIGNLLPGSYHLKLATQDQLQSAVLEFIKL